MRKIILIPIFLFCFTLFGQDISIAHSVFKAKENTYQVSIKISGEESLGILKLTLTIPDEYTFEIYNNTNLLIDTRGRIVKFYSSFDSGNQIEINCKLTKEDKDDSEAYIPVQIQYSLNGEMMGLEKEIILSENEPITEHDMDSLSLYYTENSKKFKSHEELSLTKMKELPTTTVDKKKTVKNELTSMPPGYNSTAQIENNTPPKYYSIQILSLQFFNETRFNDFLSTYKLKMNDVYKKEVNGMVKIYIGKFVNYDEAKKLKEKLINQNNLTDSFVVSY